MKKMFEKWWPLLAFVFFTLIYYSNLFFPRLSVFFTPDLGRSDVFSNFSLTVFIAEKLKKFEVPVWINLLGTGIPLVGTGLTDFFSLVQIVTRYFFSPPIAFNLFFIFHSLIALFGTYFLGRHCQLTRLASVFAAVTFAFSGFFIARITHGAVFSTAAFLPLVFLFSLRLLEKGKLNDGLLLAFFISQQILAGHIQFFFITLIGLFLTIIFHLLFSGDRKSSGMKNSFFIFVAIIFGGLLAAVQIIPMFEYKNYSVRNLGLDFESVTSNSLTPKFLLNLIYPFFFGNPANGSYPLYHQDWDYFWEKMDHIGLIPPIFILMALFTPKSNQPYKKVIILLLLSSILFGLGKYSPLFFIYFFPPFNLFHIPARFILLIVFALSLLAGYGLDIFLKKRQNSVIFGIILLLLVFIPSLLIYSSYQLVVPLQEAIKEPESYSVVKNKTGRIYQLGGGWPYLQQLFNFGWQDPAYYFFAKNSLDVNMNVLYHIPQTGVYFPLLTERQNIIQNLLINEAQGDFNQTTASLSALHNKALNLTGTHFLISPFKIQNDGLILKKTISSTNKTWMPFYVYENPGFLPRLRLINKYLIANNTQEALAVMKQADFNPQETAVLENISPRKLQPANVKLINIIRDRDEEIIVDLTVDKENLLILSDSYLPGWLAFVDDKQVPIYPANINQKAIFVSQGEHRVKFIYQPQSIRLGMTVSLIAFIFWIFLLIKGILFKTNPS